MPLESGTRLGPYEISAQIGVGGMGEVYRATDTKLDRQVAIKVLPEAFASDPERLARFDREAKTLAALNHPNIAQIHGLEESDGIRALVMELVEGPTLADRIAQSAVTVDEALPIAKQIAEALEAAHEHGIIHRDLKPANVKVRPDGTVKVLDFGLAKAMEPAGAMSASASMSPTITTPAQTMQGAILGTAAYMSPEQAKGKVVDRRADIWAFGAVLYEMLTGQKPFSGDDVSTTLARVIEREPDWDVLPSNLSPVLATYLRRCLAKEPRQRVHDIADVRLALEGAFETDSSQVVGAAAVAQPTWRQPLPVAMAASVVAVLVCGLAAWSLWPTPEPGVVSRFDYDLPEEQAFRNTGRPAIALAPDASAFVYNTAGGLYLRTIGELEAQLMLGTEPHLTSPFFSPDGQQVAYWDVEQQLKRIGTTGGTPVVIADNVANPWGVSWGPDDMILIGQPEGIMRVSATGGTPELVIPAMEGESLYGAQLLPDRNSVLFSATTADWDDGQIVAQSLTTGERTVLVEGGTDAQYVPTGHLVYALGDGLFAMAFDPDSLTVSGGAVPLAQGLRRGVPNTSVAHYGVSQNGTLVYVPGSSAVVGARTFVWVDRDGNEELAAAAPADYQEFNLSPDGTRVAVRINDGLIDQVWIYDLTRDTSTRLTFESDNVGAVSPTWTPDGTRVAFGTPLSWKRADGVGEVEPLDAEGQRFPMAFSPDGTTLVFREGSTLGLGVLTLDGDRAATVLLDEEFNESGAVLSPDGRWLAYLSDETGELQVYVRPFPDVDSGRWRISTDGGQWPVWSPGGNELFYRGPTGVMVLAFETEPTFTPGALTQLFQWQFDSAGGNRRMAVAPDGQRFLLFVDATSSADTTPPQIIVVQNWFSELERLVPVD